jgi:hypothetical protein
MVVLQIEHKVANYGDWKKVFDSDPIDRKGSGVKSYRIYQPADNPNYVIIDLVFENLANTESALAALRKLWEKVQGTVIFDPKTRILNVMEEKRI